MEQEMFSFYKNALLGKASEKPLCDEYKTLWRACGNDKDKLIRFALRQQSLPFLMTYCNDGKGLSKEYVTQAYKDYINGKKIIHDADEVKGYTYALYVGNAGIFFNTVDVLAMMWINKTHCTILETKCPTIYVGCGSNVHLSLNGYNNIRLHLYDNSTVMIEDADENSKVIAYKYSDDAKVEAGRFCFAEVREVRKDLKLQL